MSDNNNHAEIIELVREAAQAGDAYHLARERLAEALGLNPEGRPWRHSPAVPNHRNDQSGAPGGR
jgi:hypothetical protein